MTVNNDTQKSTLASFVILSILLTGFTLSVLFLGYLAALIFGAIVAGFVLWWSRHGRRR